MQEKQDIEGLLAEGKSIQVKPQGYSMYPLFVPGRDEAVIAPVGNRRVKRGDVVLYRRPGSILVLHRVWKRRGNRFYFVGDNQKEVEGPLDEEQIKGILIGLVRNGRSFDVKNPVYGFLSGVWLFLRPIRPILSGAAAWVKRWISGRNGKRG
jgi:hypothetical protein